MRRWLSASNSSDEACPCVLLFSAVLPVPPWLKEPAVRMVEYSVLKIKVDFNFLRDGFGAGRYLMGRKRQSDEGFLKVL